MTVREAIAQLGKMDPDKQVDAVISLPGEVFWVGVPETFEDGQHLDAVILHITATQEVVA